MRCLITTYQVWTEELDVKSLIPDSNVRRRLSPFVKRGVTTGLQAVKNAESVGVFIDSIVTATGLGCLEDSEKFLKNYLTSEEQLLNPTPFIQSTHNTIGGQIALGKQIHGYNLTFSHRKDSFINALMDALLLLRENESKAVLLGAVDEVTATSRHLLQRLGWNKTFSEPKDVCAFFVLTSADKTATSPLEGLVSFDDELAINASQRQILLEINSNDMTNLSDCINLKADEGSFLSMADSLVSAILHLEQGAEAVKVSDSKFSILLKWHS